MIVFANYLVALTSKKAMCLQSSDIVRNIMDGVTYCSGINRVVAKLIEYMDYDFTGEYRKVVALILFVNEIELAFEVLELE